MPLLKRPETPWNHPAITTFFINEFSVRTERWRHIRYIDGGEELYDHDADPEEWTNLAAVPAYKEVKEKLAGYIPEDPAPFVETSYQIMPHHLPPARSVEDYLARRGGQ